MFPNPSLPAQKQPGTAEPRNKQPRNGLRELAPNIQQKVWENPKRFQKNPEMVRQTRNSPKNQPRGAPKNVPEMVWESLTKNCPRNGLGAPKQRPNQLPKNSHRNGLRAPSKQARKPLLAPLPFELPQWPHFPPSWFWPKKPKTFGQNVRASKSA